MKSSYKPVPKNQEGYLNQTLEGDLYRNEMKWREFNRKMARIREEQKDAKSQQGQAQSEKQQQIKQQQYGITTSSIPEESYSPMLGGSKS